MYSVYYRGEENRIIIPAAFVLADEMFRPNIPNYINYGAAGTVIGHEITHGLNYLFDDPNGKDNDNEGNFSHVIIKT